MKDNFCELFFGNRLIGAGVIVENNWIILKYRQEIFILNDNDA